MLNGQIEKSLELYTVDACVIDAGNGQSWIGKVKLRRGTTICLHLIPSSIRHKNIVQQRWVSADAKADTVMEIKDNGQIKTFYSVNSNSESWTFRKVDGKWKIASFFYNLH